MTTTTTTLHEWDLAVADKRQAIKAEAYEASIEAQKAERRAKGVKGWADVTRSMEDKAKNEAKSAYSKWEASTVEYAGLRNPVQALIADFNNALDGKTEAETAAEEALADLAGWLKAQTWSEFAQSLAAQYAERGSLSPKQVQAAEKMRAKVEARRAAVEAKPEAKGLDLSAVPSGYYAVPGGDTRLKVRIAHGKDGSKWAGWTFVSDGAEYGQRRNYGSQRPGGFYKGDIVEALQTIASDPKAASMAYGRLVGKCGVCGRVLEDEQSVAKGIGPICEANAEW